MLVDWLLKEILKTINQNQTKSTNIKPNQTKSNQNQTKIKPNQLKSNQINQNQTKIQANQPFSEGFFSILRDWIFSNILTSDHAATEQDVNGT